MEIIGTGVLKSRIKLTSEWEFCRVRAYKFFRMNIDQVKNLVEQLDVATGLFDDVDPLIQTDGLEREIVAGVNRLICGVLGVPFKETLNLKNLKDVKRVAAKLATLVGFVGILQEEDGKDEQKVLSMLDEKLEQDIGQSAERYLRKVMGIREEVNRRVEAVTPVKSTIEEEMEFESKVFRFPRHGKVTSLFYLMKRNIGQCVSLDELVKIIEADPQESRSCTTRELKIKSAVNTMRQLKHEFLGQSGSFYYEIEAKKLGGRIVGYTMKRAWK